MLCSYGCGLEAKHLNKSGNWMCEISSTKCPEVKKKNREALKLSYKSGKKKSMKYVYAKLPDSTKLKMNYRKCLLFADFSLNGKGNHKDFLIKERGHCCESCKLKEWLCEPIPLELEHCDGNNKNNVKDNLLLLCPNCHAKTKFYRGRNINNGQIKVEDIKIINEINKGLNTRQILINVGLTPKGGNYSRVANLRSHIEAG